MLSDWVRSALAGNLRWGMCIKARVCKHGCVCGGGELLVLSDCVRSALAAVGAHILCKCSSLCPYVHTSVQTVACLGRHGGL